MATFHIRKIGTAYEWVLADGQDRVIARGPDSYSTRGEADAAIANVVSEIAGADIQVDTVVAESRWKGIDMATGEIWKGIDMATGEIQSGPAAETEDDNPEEFETGPPEVVVGQDGMPEPAPKDAA